MNVRAYAQRRHAQARRHETAWEWAQRILRRAPFLVGYAESERLYLEHVLRPEAERISAELSAQLTRDLTFRGEAYVHVGYDLEREAVTYERIPPEDVQPVAPAPLPANRWGPWQPSP